MVGTVGAQAVRERRMRRGISKDCIFPGMSDSFF
jgi:hypothetical protein